MFVWLGSCVGAQDPNAFEGAWAGSFTHNNQPRNFVYVFEKIQGTTCSGFFWTVNQHAWTKCEIKDGQISAYAGSPPVLTVTGKAISSTELQLTWHAQKQIYSFFATKQTTEFRRTLIDPTEVAGVERQHMGIYRALSELIMDSFKKKDFATAAKLSRIMEISWDRGETELNTKSRQTWGQIDAAMDKFILPIIDYKKTMPDVSNVTAAYQTFLEKLKDGEQVK
jgi:hypothetical protein